MAHFVGSFQEFHHFIGPRIRNRINTAAAPYRRRIGGICPGCGNEAELQSAHIHGRERRVLIEQVLAEFKREDGSVMCDLTEVERRIIEAHMPINETFKFLCHRCHIIYDILRKPNRMNIPCLKGQFKKIGRVQLWANRPMQAPHKIIRAFLNLATAGDVDLSNFKIYCEETLKISGFAGKYASMKTDAGNSYGKVFFDNGRIVQMWPEIKLEVVAYFQMITVERAIALYPTVTAIPTMAKTGDC